MENMARRQNYIAIDLGAESGRVICGQFDGERLELTDTHRFTNAPVRLPDGLHTDVLRIWAEIKAGMTHAAHLADGEIAGVGVDSWGVDFALLDKQGVLLSNPYQYRDSMMDGMMEEAFRRVPRAEIFEQTGIQFMQINTLYQLLALQKRQSPLLDAASSLLWIPDLFTYWLSGILVNESSIASTSQCYDPRRGTWALPMLEKFGLPTHLFRPLVPPGTRVGDLTPAIAEEVGLKRSIPVITPGGHDTALAVAAVPAQGKDFVYLSSGTWSLMGAELSAPCISPQSLAGNFTNEGGVCQTVRFLKNITGLWVVQECRRTWACQGDELSYADLMTLAADATPLRFLIDVESSEFSKPGDMPARIQAYCQRTGQPVPKDKGAILRCALESLALKYRQVLDDLERTLGRRLEPLHIVGGGSQNTLLSQFAADATGRQVVAGPKEATAIGSMIMQAMALGKLGSLTEGRELVGRSFEVTTFEPKESAVWEEAYQRFCVLIRKA
jgi:rhamnulokinase